GDASRRHRPRHRSLNPGVIEATGAVAIRDPGALHVAQFCLLLVIEVRGEALVVLVEKIVPDCAFEAIAIGPADIGLAFGPFHAWRPYQVEQALAFDFVQVARVVSYFLAQSRMAAISFRGRLAVLGGAGRSRS